MVSELRGVGRGGEGIFQLHAYSNTIVFNEFPNTVDVLIFQYELNVTDLIYDIASAMKILKIPKV